MDSGDGTLARPPLASGWKRGGWLALISDRPRAHWHSAALTGPEGKEPPLLLLNPEKALTQVAPGPPHYPQHKHLPRTESKSLNATHRFTQKLAGSCLCDSEPVLTPSPSWSCPTWRYHTPPPPMVPSDCAFPPPLMTSHSSGLSLPSCHLGNSYASL